MHTDVACLTESSKFFDDSYNELGNCINLLNNAINDAILVSDGSFGERLSTVKNNLSTINNELDTIIGYINKTNADKTKSIVIDKDRAFFVKNADSDIKS